MVDALCSTPIGNDTVALMNLNKLFVELKNNLISIENLNKMNHSNQKTPPYSGRNTIPRSNTAPSLRFNKKRMNITDFDFSPAMKDRKRTNHAGDHSPSGEDVVVRLNSLMGDLESSFSSFLKSGDAVIDTDAHHLHDVNNNNPVIDVSEDDDEIFQPSPADRYVLDNFTQYLYRKYSLRSKAYTSTTTTRTKPIKPPRRMSDSRLNDYQHRYRQTRNSSSSSDSGDSTSGSAGMLYNISHHHTLCRRLKTLEASFGSTLKKQLHSVILKRMREMNVAGCVYCLYALYVSSSVKCVKCDFQF